MYHNYAVKMRLLQIIEAAFKIYILLVTSNLYKNL